MTFSFQMPKNHKKKTRKGKSGNRGPTSDALGSQAGKSSRIPRASMGHDTLLGLAQSQRRTIVCASALVVTTAAGAYTEATNIVMNGPFAPAGGASAVGYAKYMAFYSKSFVLASRIKVCGALNGATGFTNPNVLGVVITTNGTSLGGFGAAIANGMCDWTVMEFNPDRFTFNLGVDVGKFLNKPKVLDDPRLFGTSSANPTDIIVAHVFLQPLSGTAASSVLFAFEVEYDVVFTDPIPFT
jgi:hypothetical protein